MRVKMLDSHTGTVWPDQGFVHCLNHHEYDVPEAVGKKWVEIGLAVLCDAPVLATDDKSEKKAGPPKARPSARENKGGD